jgi:hypothetical protein
MIRRIADGYANIRTYRHPCAKSWWWTPERDAKLRYVMEHYGDLEKAVRVLGLPSGNGGWVIRRWNHLRFGERQA